MKIAIYGCGAMGTVLGAYLNKSGLQTILIDRKSDHINALNKNGATITGCDNFTVPVQAITPEQMKGKYDLVFVMIKQTANSIALPRLKNFLHHNSVVCTLQNGIPERDVENYIGGNRTVGGTALWGATFIGPGVSEITQNIYSDNILFDIGEIDGSNTDRIEMVSGVLKHMGDVTIVENLIGARWSKLILNSCMSGMSAVTGSSFGDVLKNTKASLCLSYIANEIINISDKAGIQLENVMNMDMRDFGRIDTLVNIKNSQNCFEKFYADKLTAKASMLQDLEDNKMTEVDFINGYIVEQGKKYGVPAKYNNTVVEVIKRIENKKLSLSMDNLNFFTLTN